MAINAVKNCSVLPIAKRFERSIPGLFFQKLNQLVAPDLNLIIFAFHRKNIIFNS
jgi:hypothetical protein